jgi:2'-5' RNA ligase
MTRTFIAVELTSDLRRALRDVQARLQTGGADVNWVEEGNLHFTVKFLGNVEDERLPQVTAAVRLAVNSLSRFAITMGGVGAFPSLNHPRVVWAGLTSGDEPFKTLMERVDAAMENLDFPREERAPHPHVTLGRVREKGRLRRLPELLQAEPVQNLGTMTIEKLTVMASRLTPKGAQYTPLEHVKIGVME